MFRLFLKEGDYHNLPGQPVQVLSHPYSGKLFHDVQREPSVFQCVPLLLPVATTEKSLALSSVSLQVFLYFDKVAHEPSLLQAELLHLS